MKKYIIIIKCFKKIRLGNCKKYRYNIIKIRDLRLKNLR